MRTSRRNSSRDRVATRPRSAWAAVQPASARRSPRSLFPHALDRWWSNWPMRSLECRQASGRGAEAEVLELDANKGATESDLPHVCRRLRPCALHTAFNFCMTNDSLYRASCMRVARRSKLVQHPHWSTRTLGHHNQAYGPGRRPFSGADPGQAQCSTAFLKQETGRRR